MIESADRRVWPRGLGIVLVVAVGALPAGATCTDTPTTLCLGADERFALTASWQTNTATGNAFGTRLTSDTGTFWFFDPANVELVVKVLDGCGQPLPRYWVFAGGLTDVGVELTVSDTVTGAIRRYSRPAGVAFAPLQDTGAFHCGAAPTPSATLISDTPGKNWDLPSWAQPAVNSGFFSEQAAPQHHIDTRSVDLTWRQLQPQPTVWSTTTADSVYGMSFGSFNEQLTGSDPYWLRVWVSGADWAPQWVQAQCGVSPVGNGYENDPQLPLWNPCLWQHARTMYRTLLLERNLRADPRLRFVYVPGAFTWTELDLDIPSLAAERGELSFGQFASWYHQAIADLVTIMNGDNDDPTDDYAWKLVWTAEDYPFSPWGSQDDLLARDAVAAGMGIRNGITEVFNFHLSEVPAYGVAIAANGHLVRDPSWPLFDGKRIIGAENECFTSCGFTATDIEYAVEMANLKALQLGVNWLYVVPEDSYLAAFSQHWRWVRQSLGHHAASSPDAWVALREAEDRYWLDDSSKTWTGRPWIRNLERFMVQLEPAGAVTRRGSEVRQNELSPDNGTAYEGRRTNRGNGSSAFAFAVDDGFLDGAIAAATLHLTYLDSGLGAFWVEVAVAGSTSTFVGPAITRQGTGQLRTASMAIAGVQFAGTLAGGADLIVRTAGPDDLELRFVRLVRNTAP